MHGTSGPGFFLPFDRVVCSLVSKTGSGSVALAGCNLVAIPLTQPPECRDTRNVSPPWKPQPGPAYMDSLQARWTIAHWEREARVVLLPAGDKAQKG